MAGTLSWASVVRQGCLVMSGGIFRRPPDSSLPTVLLDNLSLRVRRPSRSHHYHRDRAPRFARSNLFSPHMNSTSSPGALPPPQVLHGTRVPLILASQSVLLVLALLFYSLRIYSRSRPTLHFMSDDYIITLSVVSVKKHLQSFVTLTFNSSARALVSALTAKSYPMDMATTWIRSLLPS